MRMVLRCVPSDDPRGSDGGLVARNYVVPVARLSFQVSAVNVRIMAPSISAGGRTLKLYGYQARDVKRIEESMRKGRTLYALPTGGGKTVVAVAIMRRAVAKKLRVLFLVHRRELVDQAVARLNAGGVARVGVILAGRDWDRDALVHVASIQTLRDRDIWPAADLVLIDEGHHTPAASYQSIVARFPKAKMLGLTATPFRKDDSGLRLAFDHLVQGPMPSELIKLGVLMAPSVKTVPDRLLPSLKGIKRVGGDYEKGALAKRMKKRVLIGGIVEHLNKHAKGRPAVLYAVNVEHAKACRVALEKRGIVAEHLDGTTCKVERNAILTRLRTGKTQVVTNCDVLTEGWDFPALGAVILARPTWSRGLYLQMCGRALRSHRGKRKPVILDHAGNASKHGRPEQDRTYTLDDRKRRTSPLSPVKDKNKRCPECEESVPCASQECAYCGHLFQSPAEVKVIKGWLEEAKPKPTSEERRSNELQSLNNRLGAMANKKGLSTKWVETAISKARAM